MHIVYECFRVAYKLAGTTYPPHPVFSGSVLLIISVFCVSLLCFFTFWVPVCDVRYEFCIKTTFGSSLPPVVCRQGSCHVYVICVCLPIVVSNTYCVLYLFCFGFFFVLVLCTIYIAGFSGLYLFDCFFRIL